MATENQGYMGGCWGQKYVILLQHGINPQEDCTSKMIQIVSSQKRRICKVLQWDITTTNKRWRRDTNWVNIWNLPTCFPAWWMMKPIKLCRSWFPLKSSRVLWKKWPGTIVLVQATEWLNVFYISKALWGWTLWTRFKNQDSSDTF